MKIIQRYITVNLLWTTLLALFALVSLFSFFTLIDELKDTGRGSYGAGEAVLYVILTVPRLAFEVFPIAAVIGSMSVLGMMVRSNELDVIRTAGVSSLRLSWVMVKSSVLLVLFAVVIGEWVAPASEEAAQSLRSVALTEQITLRTRYGLWVRDDNSYINIRRLLPGNRVEDVYFYEFNNRHNLQRSVYARSAVYADGVWQLENIRESVFTDSRVESRRLRQANWESLLEPDILDVVTVRPQYLTMVELTGYINYLKQNAQNTRLYEQALWAKIIKPFSILAMIILAVPLVRGHSKFTAVGQRVFVGAMAGILFHLSNQVSTNLGIVYQIHPLLSVVAPTLLLVFLIIVLLRD